LVEKAKRAKVLVAGCNPFPAFPAFPALTVLTPLLLLAPGF